LNLENVLVHTNAEDMHCLSKYRNLLNGLFRILYLVHIVHYLDPLLVQWRYLACL